MVPSIKRIARVTWSSVTWSWGYHEAHGIRLQLGTGRLDDLRSSVQMSSFNDRITQAPGDVSGSEGRCSFFVERGGLLFGESKNLFSVIRQFESIFLNLCLNGFTSGNRLTVFVASERVKLKSHFGKISALETLGVSERVRFIEKKNGVRTCFDLLLCLHTMKFIL